MTAQIARGRDYRFKGVPRQQRRATLARSRWRVGGRQVAGVGHDPYAALRYRDFRLLTVGRFIGALADQMLNVAIGWELYERTRSALVLGFVGLAVAAPVVGLSLFGGHIADRRDRRSIMLAAQVLLIVATLALTALSMTRGPLPLIYGTLALLGVVYAFSGPASSAVVAEVVPAEAFASAATWNSSAWQLASVAGPALGGVIIAVTKSATPVYALDALGTLLVIVLIALMRTRQPARDADEPQVSTLRSLREGLSFVWGTKIILATITLDMFAVLLGGATTLLPVYALDILHVGPAGLGALRAAPSVGALLVALALAYLPPLRHAGWALLSAVALFGAATLVFGVSRSFPLSLAMLALLGGVDNISVVIRAAILLLNAPDVMRGRVSSVSSIFVSMSNEVGGFESGLTAQLFGPTLAVAAGGVASVVIVVLVALIWPEIRRLGYLNQQMNA